MEEGTLSEWLYEVLEPHVEELVVEPDRGENRSSMLTGEPLHPLRPCGALNFCHLGKNNRRSA